MNFLKKLQGKKCETSPIRGTVTAVTISTPEWWLQGHEPSVPIAMQTSACCQGPRHFLSAGLGHKCRALKHGDLLPRWRAPTSWCAFQPAALGKVSSPVFRCALPASSLPPVPCLPLRAPEILQALGRKHYPSPRFHTVFPICARVILFVLMAQV